MRAISATQRARHTRTVAAIAMVAIMSVAALAVLAAPAHATTYTPPWMYGFKPSSATVNTLTRMGTQTSVAVSLVTPDDHNGRYYADWNESLSNWMPSSPSGTPAVASIGLSMNSYGTFYPTWSMKGLSMGHCSDMGRPTAANHGTGTTYLSRGESYQFQMSASTNGSWVWFNVSTASGVLIWSHGNQTPSGNNYYSLPAYSTDGRCYGGADSGIPGTYIHETVHSTVLEAVPGYSFWWETPNWVAGGTSYNDTNTWTVATVNSPPAAVHGASYNGSGLYGVYGIIENQAFEDYFGNSYANAPNYPLTAATLNYNTKSNVEGFVYSFYGNGNDFISGVNWTGSGVTAVSYTNTGATPPYYFNVSIWTSNVHGANAYVYVEVQDPGVTVETETVLFVTVA